MRDDRDRQAGFRPRRAYDNCLQLVLRAGLIPNIQKQRFLKQVGMTGIGRGRGRGALSKTILAWRKRQQAEPDNAAERQVTSPNGSRNVLAPSALRMHFTIGPGGCIAGSRGAFGNWVGTNMHSSTSSFGYAGSGIRQQGRVRVPPSPYLAALGNSRQTRDSKTGSWALVQAALTSQHDVRKGLLAET